MSLGEGVFRLVIAIFLTFLTAISVYDVYLDLYTKERKSVKHLRFKPKKEASYLFTAHATIFCVFSYCVLAYTDALYMLHASNGACAIYFVPNAFFYQYSKLAMYLVFSVLLQSIFGQSVHAYSSTTLITGISLLLFYNIILSVITILYFIGLDDYCELTFGSAFAVIWIAMLVCEDLCFSGVFLAAFVLPLRRALVALDTSTRDLSHTKSKSKIKFYYAAVRVTILTSVALLSTVIAGLVGISTDFYTLMTVDYFINSMCVLLMTHYWPATRYYQRLCWCCIKCCTPRSEAYKAIVRHQSERRPSINRYLATSDVDTDTEVSPPPSSCPTINNVPSASQSNTKVAQGTVDDKPASVEIEIGQIPVQEN